MCSITPRVLTKSYLIIDIRHYFYILDVKRGMEGTYAQYAHINSTCREMRKLLDTSFSNDGSGVKRGAKLTGRSV